MTALLCFILPLLVASAFGYAPGPLGIDSATNASAIYLPDLNLAPGTHTLKATGH
jgi:hypothetical protein